MSNPSSLSVSTAVKSGAATTSPVTGPRVPEHQAFGTPPSGA